MYLFLGQRLCRLEPDTSEYKKLWKCWIPTLPLSELWSLVSILQLTNRNWVPFLVPKIKISRLHSLYQTGRHLGRRRLGGRCKSWSLSCSADWRSDIGAHKKHSHIEKVRISTLLLQTFETLNLNTNIFKINWTIPMP